MTLLPMLACSSLTYEGGLTVDLDMVHHLGAGDSKNYDTGAPRPLVSDDGADVAMDRGLLVFGSIELLTCTVIDSVDMSGALGGVLRNMALVSVAHAHQGGSAQIYGVPIIFDLMAADQQVQHVGRMAPPPDSYCGVRISAKAADRDAPGLDEAPDMLGRVMLATGHYTPTDTGQERDFVLESALLHRVTLPFAEPLVLDADRPMSHLLIELDYGGLLAGVDLASDETELVGSTVVTNLLDGISVRVCDDAVCPEGA